MTVDHLAHLEHDAAAVVDVLRAADPAATVPGCPGWALRDLAVHLGTVHRWAAAVVRSQDKQPQASYAVADDELADWSAQGAAEVLEALRTTDGPCWTLTGDGSTAWWRRRMALETVVHRVDAQRAAGQDPAVHPGLAEDGIAEVLDVMLPRQVALGRVEPPATGVTLVTSTTRHLGDVPPTVTVTGPAEDVLLLLWRRLHRTDPRLTVTGDVEALDRLLETPITP